MTLSIACMLAATSAFAYDLRPYQVIPTPSDADSVVIGDVVGDAANDVVVGLGYNFAPTTDYSIAVFESLPDGTLAPALMTKYLGGYPGEPRIALLDFDRDGTRDIVVGDQTGLSILKRDSSATWVATKLSTTPWVNVLESGDVDGDGAQDLIVLGNGITVLFNNGSGAIARTQTFAAPPNARDVELGDLNNDGYRDLVFAARPDMYSAAAIMYHDRVAGFLSPVYFTTPSDWSPEGVAVGDFNGDNRDDVAIAIGGNRPNSAIYTFTQDALGNLSAPTRYSSYDIPEPLLATDIDGDGRDDLATVHAGWNALGFYLQESPGVFSPERLAGLPYATWWGASQGLAAGDINRDGCIDFGAPSYNHGLVLLHGYGCIVPPPPPPKADLVAGAQITSTTARVIVTNAGPDAAAQVTSSATIRGRRIAIRTLDPRCQIAPSAGLDVVGVTCTFGTLANGATATADIGITFKPPQGASIQHSVSSATGDPNAGNNSASASAAR